jgi:hypothetical protein
LDMRRNQSQVHVVRWAFWEFEDLYDTRN